MNAIQIPPITSPSETASTMPAAITPIARTRETCMAMPVARRRSPVTAQAMPRRVRPPSSGRAGSMLNTARIRLIIASHQNTVWAACGRPDRLDRPYSPRPSTSDTAGPVSAIRISAAPLGKKPSKRATPPKSHSVMLWMVMPSRRASSAWPNSCSRIDSAKATAEIVPIAR